MRVGVEGHSTFHGASRTRKIGRGVDGGCGSSFIRRFKGHAGRTHSPSVTITSIVRTRTRIPCSRISGKISNVGLSPWCSAGHVTVNVVELPFFDNGRWSGYSNASSSFRGDTSAASAVFPFPVNFLHSITTTTRSQELPTAVLTCFAHAFKVA
jgi:hypothetical protein